jgi:dipeptidyl aminopeptidase/acylaminoacyl peptidase
MKPAYSSRIYLLFICCLHALFLNAQDAASYQTPPKTIADLATAAPTPGVSFDSKGRYMLLTERSSMPGVEELAQPEWRIAGLRINPNNFGPSRGGYSTGISIKDIETGQTFTPAGLPKPLRADNFRWSPAESKFLFIQSGNQRIDLYVVDLKTRSARQINKTPVNMTMGGSIRWLDENTVMYETTLKPASAAPARPLKPQGPVVQQNMGKQAAAVTFQDLIKSSYDEQLFEFYATSQLVKNTNGMEIKIGAPAIYTNIDPSPDGRYLLLEKIRKPFSYLVPAGGFNRDVVMADAQGKPVKTIAQLPSSELAPRGFDNVLNAPRGFRWHGNMPASLMWIEPLDSGLVKKNMAERDVLIMLEAPFTGKQLIIGKTAMRLQAVSFTNSNFMLVTEGLAGKQKQKTSLLYWPSLEMKPLFERSTGDEYNNPGTPLTVKNQFNRMVVNVTDDKLWMRGQGASAKGDFPFLSTYNINTKETVKLWQCEDKMFESLVAITDWSTPKLIISRQSQTETPNYFLRNLSDKSLKPLTQFPDPQQAMAGVQKQKITYQRKDGLSLSGDLYLPKGYDAQKDGPLPVVMWAYPREFKNASDAAQVRGSQYTYTRISSGSPLFWVTQGYAVLDNAEMPIVGEGDKQPNDNFIEQLQWNAEAAIDKLAAMGVGDRNRIAVGGHSYGAFMTVNLLAHTNLFRAGIARSGAYNRTLTPFGFQNEERTYWQAPEVYQRMSPFSYADKIKTPLLMIHGEADNNPGTFPIQSERLFNAIKGHGGTVRFVSLPFESHGYAAKENILHMLWEQHEWLEKYVKYAKPAGAVGKALPTAAPAENSAINIKGSYAVENSPLFLLNGKEVAGIEGIDPNNIAGINVVKGNNAVKKYGDKGRNGAVEITLKNAPPVKEIP